MGRMIVYNNLEFDFAYKEFLKKSYTTGLSEQARRKSGPSVRTPDRPPGYLAAFCPGFVLTSEHKNLRLRVTPSPWAHVVYVSMIYQLPLARLSKFLGQ